MMLRVTTNDLLQLIEQSENSISEKSEMEKMIKDNGDEFVAEQVEGGVLCIFKDESEFIIKGITMSQIFNNKR